jgi:hypothetical protein
MSKAYYLKSNVKLQNWQKIAFLGILLLIFLFYANTQIAVPISSIYTLLSREYFQRVQNQAPVRMVHLSLHQRRQIRVAVIKFLHGNTLSSIDTVFIKFDLLRFHSRL